ncbi:unnamed protein product [Ectocarpus sp. 13 AM-2016]
MPSWKGRGGSSDSSHGSCGTRTLLLSRTVERWNSFHKWCVTLLLGLGTVASLTSRGVVTPRNPLRCSCIDLIASLPPSRQYIMTSIFCHLLSPSFYSLPCYNSIRSNQA